MTRSLNYNTIKKQYLNITLADEKNTVLMIGTPTKAVMNSLLTLADTFKDVNEEDVSPEIMDSLYEACAKIMSANKCGIKITTKDLEELFDFEDIFLFYTTYMNFVSEITSSKN